ncbi:MAG: hypothetical protein J1F61_06565, partial [Clostridiales bacterium]|nr:hypothetical protein [Clostridiales bacterium]
MKKYFIHILAAMATLCLGVALFSACGSSSGCGSGCGKSHEHTYATEWSKDESGHWYSATCGHTDKKSNFGEHVDQDNNGKCDVCNYVIWEATALAAPTITLVGNIIKWDAVENADGYEVYEGTYLVSTQAERGYIIEKESVGEYTFTVKATSTSARYLTSPASAPIIFKYNPTVLSAPVIEISGNVITWSAIENAESYRIYEDGTVVSEVQELQYIAKPTEGGTHRYAVMATSTDYNYASSLLSNTVTYTVEKLETPEAYVGGLYFNYLKWNSIENAQEYEVYENGTLVAKCGSSTLLYQLTRAVSNGDPAGTYIYTVVAATSDTDYISSSPSEDVEYLVPETPGVIGATMIEIESDRLVWKPIPYAWAYEVMCNGQMFMRTQNTYYKLSNLTAGVEYKIQVRGVCGNPNYVTEGELSNEITYTRQEETVVFPTPAAPEITLNGNVITWQPVEYATEYSVRVRWLSWQTMQGGIYKNYSDFVEIVKPADDGTLSYVIGESYCSGYIKDEYGNRTPTYHYYKDAVDETYIFFVKALTPNRVSESSNEVEYKITVTQLDAPVATLNGNVISWNAVANAEQYEIFENNIKVATVTQTSYTINKTIIGTYTYFVVATSSDVTYSKSNPSEMLVYQFMYDATKLEAPGIWLDELEGNKIIKWNAVENATSYFIYENGARVATVNSYGEETLFYILIRQTPGTYEYGVKAASASNSYRTSEMSNIVSHTVAATEMTYSIVVTVPVGYTGPTTLEVGIYKDGQLIESKQITIDTSDSMSGTETFTQMADEYTVKLITEIPDKYIVTQAVVTADNAMGVIRVIEQDKNKLLKMGINTFTVTNVDGAGADQEYLFIAENSGVYTFRTDETKDMMLEIDGIIGIETTQGINVYSISLYAGEAIKVVFVGNTIGNFTVEIIEGEVKQYLKTTTGWGVFGGANYLYGSCTRYLNLDVDTVFTFSFTTATMNLAIVVMTIDGVEYEFDGDAFNTQNILIKAGTDIEITFVVIGVEFTRANY